MRMGPPTAPTPRPARSRPSGCAIPYLHPPAEIASRLVPRQSRSAVRKRKRQPATVSATAALPRKVPPASSTAASPRFEEPASCPPLSSARRRGSFRYQNEYYGGAGREPVRSFHRTSMATLLLFLALQLCDALTTL